MEYSSKPFNISIVTDNEVSLLESTKETLMGTSPLQAIAVTGISVIGYKCLKPAAYWMMSFLTERIKEKIDAAVTNLVFKKTSNLWEGKYQDKMLTQFIEKERNDLFKSNQAQKESFDAWIKEQKESLSDRIKLEIGKLEDFDREKKEIFDQRKRQEKDELAESIRRIREKEMELITKEKEKLDLKLKTRINDWTEKEKNEFLEWIKQEKTELVEWQRKVKTDLNEWIRKEMEDLLDWKTKEKNDLVEWKRKEKEKNP